MWLEQDNVDVLAGCADSDPAETAVRYVDTDLEAESVAVKAESCVWILDRNEHCGDGDCHAEQCTSTYPLKASPILLASELANRSPSRLRLWRQLVAVGLR